MGHASAVKKSVTTLKHDRDRAAVELAIHTAELLDAMCQNIDVEEGLIPDPVGYAKVAGELRQVLVELGLTPRSRAAILKAGGEADDDGPDPVDELRARRRARLDDS